MELSPIVDTQLGGATSCSLDERGFEVGSHHMGPILASQDASRAAQSATDVEYAPTLEFETVDHLRDVALAARSHEALAPNQFQHGDHRVVVLVLVFHD